MKQKGELHNLDMTHPVECDSVQVYEDAPEDQEEEDPVWRPVPHSSAQKHTTGEATYLDDIPAMNSM